MKQSKSQALTLEKTLEKNTAVENKKRESILVVGWVAHLTLSKCDVSTSYDRPHPHNINHAITQRSGIKFYPEGTSVDCAHVHRKEVVQTYGRSELLSFSYGVCFFLCE